MQVEIFEKLKTLGIDDAAFADAQILCLPENILRAAEGEELFETTDTHAFVKQLREAGVPVFTLIDAGIDLPLLDRRGGDKWLGTVWIRDTLVIPTLIALVTGIAVLEYDRATEKDKTPPPKSRVHIDLIVDKKGGNHQHIKFEGDGETLIGVLKALNEQH